MSRPLTEKPPGLGAVVLAAGGSSRLGRPKQLLRVGTETLIVRSVRLALQVVGPHVTVVLGAEQLRLRSSLRRRRLAVEIAFNPGWAEGMSGSLRTGLGRLGPQAQGALVLLVDQPTIGLRDLQRLVRRWRRCPELPVAAGYGGRIGAPAVIPRRLFRQARQLRGDVGARGLLRGLGRVRTVPMPHAGFDIDTEADLRAMQGARRRRS